jgi:iron complex outermembrane recepter protein
MTSRTRINSRRRNALLVGTSILAASTMLLAGVAYADDADGSNSNSNIETVTVTGSRVISNGNDMPTPVTVVTVEQLQATTPSDIPDALNKLPVFDASRSQRTTGGSTINWPGNFLNLRNFGTNRTLILLDGMRVPATDSSNEVDANTLPQALMQRVDIVTGGASAVYGSDAVTGVVNFVLDHHFDGLKFEAEGGISTYGDDADHKFGAVWGTDVGANGHFEMSFEDYRSDGIPNDFQRPLGQLVPMEMGNGAATGNGTSTGPYHIVLNMRNTSITPGGYIASGPLANMTFVDNGVLGAFVHGTPENGPNEQGGMGGFSGEGYYLFPGAQSNPSMLASLKSDQFFSRFDYDLTDNIHAFIMGDIEGSGNYSISGVQSFTNLTFAADNAFLPANAQALLNGAGASTFQMSKALYNDLGAVSENYTNSGMLMAGLSGTLDGFNWDAHYTHGVTIQHEQSPGTLNMQRLQAATDAVVNPATGQIVCRVDLTAAGAAAYPGCQPFDAFGPNADSSAAFNYVTDNIQYSNVNTMDDFGASIDGTVYDGWAGPIKAALDAEYRRLALRTISTNSPTQKVDCAYQNPLTCQSSLAVWNGAVANLPTVSETVYEFAAETDIPVLKDLPLIQLLDFNAAARYTHYSISGAATTWKIGGVWNVVDDLKLRGTISRDIRAPTLSNLFAPLNVNYSAFTDYLTNVSGNTTVGSQGNPDLKPEVAITNTAGFIYTPSWLNGFSVSADWYEISIHNVITSISGGSATSEQICIASGGTSPYCGLVTRPHPLSDTSADNYPTLVLSESLNSGITNTHGIDGEVDYNFDGADVWSKIPGSFMTRLLVSYQPSLLSVTAVPGAPITNQAGAEGTNGTGSTAAGRATFNVGYSTGPWIVNLTERWHSSERPNPNPTFVYVPAEESVPQIFYTDMSVSYAFDSFGGDGNTEAFLTVENLFNQQPTLFIGTGRTGAEGYAYPASFDEDVIGRYFTAGVRLKL